MTKKGFTKQERFRNVSTPTAEKAFAIFHSQGDNPLSCRPQRAATTLCVAGPAFP